MDVLIRDQRELRQLRRVVGDFARSAGSRAGDIVLAVNELVTNSLMYGGGSCRVLGTCPTDQLVRIEVVDRGCVSFGFPADFTPPTSAGGRGLMIVRSVASRCGIDAGPKRTRVWFEIDVPAARSDAR